MIQYTDTGMFLDEAEITVIGGSGGNGLVSWRREKYVARGGPYGGDGGDGGDVIFKADANADTLSAFAQAKVFHGEDGERGKRARMAGKDGEDLVLKVPPGTVICELSSDSSASSDSPASSVADLTNPDDTVVVARGGRGGYGNAHFASSVRQAPDFAEKGEPGEVRRLKLELKLVADVGIIGLPSTGKSTLISVISAARPKIADYPFTTLVPNLGVVAIGGRLAGRSSAKRSGGRSIVVCDVPGLIEGASEGKGLGDKFLRHIERCGVLVHLLDAGRENIIADYRTIRGELERYSPVLAQKRELVALNKIDLVGNDATPFEKTLEKNGIAVFAAISAATRRGVDNFVRRLLPIVLEQRTQSPMTTAPERSPVRGTADDQLPIPVLRPHLTSERAGAFVIGEREPGVFTVRGKRIAQIASMTDWDNPAAVRRFRNIAERTGLRQALQSAGAGEESVVMIGAVDVGRHWL